jgi:hypothetical protein
MMDAKLDAHHRRMMARMNSQLREMKADTIANNKKSELLSGTLVSRMDACQGKTDANHKELMAVLKVRQGRIEAQMDISLKATEVFPKKRRRDKPQWKRNL